MKKISKIVALIASFVLCFAVFAACAPDEGKDDNNNNNNNNNNSAERGNYLDLWDKATGWTDANSVDVSPENDNAGLYAYVNKDKSTLENLKSTVKVDKFTEYDSIYYALGSEDLSSYKKLVVTAYSSGATVVADGQERTEPTKLLFKIESLPPIEGGEGKSEVTVELSSEPKTFEFDLTYEDYDKALEGATKLTFIAGPGTKDYSAEITFTEIYFSDLAPNPELVVNEKGSVSLPLVYDGTSETFNINSGFKANDGNISILVDNGATTLTVPTTKAEWEYVSTKISGNLKNFTKIKVVFTAPVGVTFKMKLEGASAAIETSTDEETLNAGTGEQKTWEWSGFTADNLTEGPEMRFLIFPSPGSSVTEEYTIVIHELVFMK